MSKKWTDWIPHEGDECPVAKDETVRVKFRQNGTSSKQHRTNEAGQWIWDVFRFSDDITHYKRLKKNVEAEKIDAEIDEFLQGDPEPSEAPTPVITGPGEYVTRDGRKAVVSFMDENSGFPFFGKVGDQDSSWTVDGSYWGVAASNADITGPWQDPDPEKPERWANLYRHEDGILHIGSTVRNSAEKVLGCRAADCVSKHIGTVLLNPGEE